MLRIDEKTATIYAYGDIGDGGMTDMDFVDALDTLSDRIVTVRINSVGGVADYGISIYEALRRHPQPVITIIDGLAASAASLIFLAGGRREISKGGRIMIHRAQAVSYGDALEFRRMATILEAYDSSLVEIYAQFMPNTKGEILKMLSAETWFTSQQALDAGLATAITGEKTTARAGVKPAARSTASRGVNQQASARKLAELLGRPFKLPIAASKPAKTQPKYTPANIGLLFSSR